MNRPTGIEWIELVTRRKRGEAPIWRVRCPVCFAVYLRVRSNMRESPESCKACAAKRREAARRGHCQRIATLPRPRAWKHTLGPLKGAPVDGTCHIPSKRAPRQAGP